MCEGLYLTDTVKLPFRVTGPIYFPTETLQEYTFLHVFMLNMTSFYTEVVLNISLNESFKNIYITHRLIVACVGEQRCVDKTMLLGMLTNESSKTRGAEMSCPGNCIRA